MKKSPEDRHTASVLVALTPAMRQEVEQLAYTERVSKAEILRRALRSYSPTPVPEDES